MSRPDDGHHSFFPIGNPFKKIFLRSSYLSPNLLALLNAFEEHLAVRFESLKPKICSDFCSLTWMSCALESLSRTHSDIKLLITDLELPVSEWDAEWINTYLGDSVKLLDICVAFSSELSHLDLGLLLLQLALSGLRKSNGSLSRQRLTEACRSLQDWIHQNNSRCPKLAYSSIIRCLAMPLYPAKVKHSAKGKVLMRAMYGVKVHTVFTLSAFAALLTASDNLLTDLPVSEKFVWSKAFTELTDAVYGGIRNEVSSRSQDSFILEELEAVGMHVKNSLTVIGDLCLPATCKRGFNCQEDSHEAIADNVEEAGMVLKTDSVDQVKVDALQHCAVCLGENLEKFARALDCLSKQLRDLFQDILSGRDALLCNLRACGTLQDDELVTGLLLC